MFVLSCETGGPDSLAFDYFGDLLRKFLCANWLGDKANKPFLAHLRNGDSWIHCRYRDDRHLTKLRKVTNLVKHYKTGHASRKHQVKDNQIHMRHGFKLGYTVGTPTFK